MSAIMWEAAKELASRGYRVFPCKNGDKLPATKNGFKDATTNVEQFYSHWRGNFPCNIGIRTGAGLVVIDVDHHGGDDGEEAFAELEAQFGKLPATLEERTPRNGRHLYFKIEPTLEVKSTKSKVGKGVDILAESHYVMCAPSKNEFGPYEWKDGHSFSDLEPAELPPAWVELIINAGSKPKRDEKQARPPREPPASGGSPYGLRALEGGCAELARMAPYTGRDSKAFAVCLRGFCLEQGGELAFGSTVPALRAALEQNGYMDDPRPDRGEKGLARIIKSAWSKSKPETAPERMQTDPQAREDLPAHRDEDAPVDIAVSEPAWPPLGPCPTEADPVPSLDPELLPAALRPWLVSTAESACIPLEIAAVPAIISLSSVVGRALGIRPERGNDWLVIPNLWGLIVTPPGGLKTFALKEGIAPLGPLIAKANIENDVASVAVAVRLVEIEARIKAITRNKAAPDHAELTGLITERSTAKAQARRYTTHDASIEKLQDLLAGNPRGILVVRDELVGLLRKLDRPENANDRAFLLEAWDGDGSYTVDRIVRGSTFINGICLSLIGGIQPGPLRSYVAEAIDGEGGADGLLQRFQIIVWPDREAPWKQTRRGVELDARNAAFDAFARLDAIPMSGDSRPSFVHFDWQAQARFAEWRNGLEARIRAMGETTPAFAAVVAKQRSLLPSLALLFHLVDGGRGDVGLPALDQALGWLNFIEAHQRKVFASELNPGRRSARLLDEKIKSGAIAHRDSVKSIYRPQWSGLRSPEIVFSGLAELEAVGRIRVVDEPSGGHPTRVVHLHPDLRCVPNTGPKGTVETVESPSDPPLDSLDSAIGGYSRTTHGEGDEPPAEEL